MCPNFVVKVVKVSRLITNNYHQVVTFFLFVNSSNTRLKKHPSFKRKALLPTRRRATVVSVGWFASIQFNLFIHAFHDIYSSKDLL